MNEGDPKIDSNVRSMAATDLALVLSKTGEQERADLLLDRSLQYIQTLQRLGLGGHWIADVQIYALQGEKQKALSALRQAIDEGWRGFWWYSLKYDPTLESLHDEPEYHGDSRRDRSRHGRSASAGARDGAQWGIGTDPRGFSDDSITIGCQSSGQDFNSSG